METALPIRQGSRTGTTTWKSRTSARTQSRSDEAAEKDLRTYIDTVPDNSEVLSHASACEWLGKLYENETKPELAVEQYKAALNLDPQNKALREALKRVQKK